MRIQIDDLRLLDRLAQAPSLSAAARSLNVTPPALSARLQKLEAALGVALATRSARRLSLTAEGERFAQEAAAILARIEALPETFQPGEAGLTGVVRVAAPFGYGRRHIAPRLARFAKRHPGLQIELNLLETPWPDRHDSDLVVHVGKVRDSSWVAHTLAPNERWLCASKAYLKARGTPREPRDLLDHACICIRENDDDATLWHFRRAPVEGDQRAAARDAVRVAPAFTTNDGSVARMWAEQGLGLVLRSEWDVKEAVRAGALVRVLAGWQFDSAPVSVLVPTRKGRSPRVQALLAFLQDRDGAAD